MMYLTVQSVNIFVEKNGGLLFSGKSKQEISLVSWGTTGTNEMRRKIEKSNCDWSVKVNEEFEFGTERGIGAENFEQQVRSLKFDSLGYITFYKDYDVAHLEIFLGKKNFASFQYLLDKFIADKNLILEIIVQDFRELSSTSSDSKIPTLDDFYNNKNGVLVNEISFALKQPSIV